MQPRTEVLIVGAGPVGLMAANLLARYDISFRIIDNDTGPIIESRALVLHIRTQELLDKLDITHKAIPDSTPIRAVNVFLKDKPVAQYAISTDEHSSPYPFTLGYDQSQTERLLIDELEQLNMQVEWQTEFVSLTQNAEGVTALIRNRNGQEQTIMSNWVIAADGYKSAVRTSLGGEYRGETYKETLFQIDAMIDAPQIAHDSIAIVQNPDLTAVIMPLPGDAHHTRLFAYPTAAIQHKIIAGQIKDITLQELQHWIDVSFFPRIRLESVNWTAAYKSHCRMAEHFRFGRCFLAGDAAHAHGPGGGQGMNLGIGDVYNLIWKLALVIKDQASTNLLDSYEAERRPVITKFMRSIKISHFLEDREMLVPRIFGRYLLPLLLRTVLRLPAVRSIYLSTISQLWIQYRRSPIVANGSPQSKGSLQSGDRAPYAAFTTKQGGLFSELKGVDHHLLLLEGTHPDAQSAQWQVMLTDLLARYKLPVTLHAISYQDYQINQAYHAEQPSIALVRPDGYLGYIGQVEQINHFATYLKRWFVPQEVLALV